MTVVARPIERLENLDGLRLVCALAVLLFHFGYRGSLDGLYAPLLPWPGLGEAFKYGHIGVHIFFAISGFVIAQSTEGRGAIAFAAARFARIYPTFLLCLVLLFAARLLWGGTVFPASWPQLAANVLLVPQVLGQPFLSGVYWSIVVEVVFYGWVFVFLALGLFQHKRAWIVALWLSAATLNEVWLQNSALRAVLLTEFAPFFVFGIALHMFVRKPAGLSIAGLLLLASVVLGLVVLARETTDIRTEFHIAISTPVSLAVLLVGQALLVLSVWQARPVLAPRVLLWAGGVSYPLYLLHEGLGQLAFERLQGVLPGPVQLLAVGLGVVMLASLVWHVFDRPVVPWVRNGILGVLPVRFGGRLARI